jgi:anaerobic selenocysteine-containing dehydrogenase
VFGWTMGITHHVHGVDNVRMLVNLALLRGFVGRPQSGLLPIRGHSNVQGIGSMGVAPQLKEEFLRNLEQHLGVTLPRSPGLDTMACMRAAAEGRMQTAFCLGGNLFGSNPDAKAAHQALGRLQQVVYVNTTLNTGHAWGRGRETLILPALARDEEPQPTTQESMFNFVRLSDGGPTRVADARSEVEILTALAQQVLGAASPVDWSALRRLPTIRAMIGRIVPGYGAISEIDATRKEFLIVGRKFDTPRFPTASGKAQFSSPAEAWRAARRGRRRAAAADDDPLRGSVQHGRL